MEMGLEAGSRGHGRALFFLGKRRVEDQLLTHFPDGWTKARHMTYPEPQTRTGLGNEDRKGWWRLLLMSSRKSEHSQTTASVFPGCFFA